MPRILRKILSLSAVFLSLLLFASVPMAEGDREQLSFNRFGNIDSNKKAGHRGKSFDEYGFPGEYCFLHIKIVMYVRTRHRDIFF